MLSNKKFRKLFGNFKTVIQIGTLSSPISKHTQIDIKSIKSPKQNVFILQIEAWKTYCVFFILKLFFVKYKSIWVVHKAFFQYKDYIIFLIKNRKLSLVALQDCYKMPNNSVLQSHKNSSTSDIYPEHWDQNF